jgi:glycerophosphoryl diester phosphodiesterase
VDCIAHRGFAGHYPENTLPAVRGAAGDADWIEIDVRRCGSGELVVIHDATVDRVSEASGRVDRLTAGELAALDVLGSGAGVPTLAATLAAIPRSVGVDVEIKEQGIAADAAGLLSSRQGPVLVSSFEPSILDAVGRVSDLARALIGDSNPDAVVDRALERDCQAVCLAHDYCRPETVERAHESGVAVYAWTIRDASTATRCVAAGVDGLIADLPGVCSVD